MEDTGVTGTRSSGEISLVRDGNELLAPQSPDISLESPNTNTPSPKAEAQFEIGLLSCEQTHDESAAVTPEKAYPVASDIEIPKRPPSAYLMFCNDERESATLACRTRHPDENLSMAEVAKELGQRWKNASNDVKSEYERVAADKKIQYRQSIHAYNAQASRIANEKQSTTDQTPSRSPDPVAPKRSKSAYMLFCDDEREVVIAAHRDKQPDGKLVMPDIAKELGQRWAGISLDARKKYESLAAQLKEQHQVEMREYLARVGHQAQKRKFLNIIKPAPTGTSPRMKKRRTLTTLDVDAVALAEAQQLSLESQFMEFVGLPEVFESGIVVKKAASARFLLRILKGAGGMVEEAKKKLQKKLQSMSK